VKERERVFVCWWRQEILAAAGRVVEVLVCWEVLAHKMQPRDTVVRGETRIPLPGTGTLSRAQQSLCNTTFHGTVGQGGGPGAPVLDCICMTDAWLAVASAAPLSHVFAHATTRSASPSATAGELFAVTRYVFLLR
jgi:hypothetical protein